MFSLERLASPEDVLDAVNLAMCSVSENSGSDRRISERIPAFLPIEFAIVNERFEVEDKSYSAVTRDISVGGLGLISLQQIDAAQILVQFKHEHASETPLLLNVHYCKSLGPVFIVGASFCADWSVPD